MRPVLFEIPFVHLPIFSYGVMLGLSLIVGWYIVLGLCERDGMNREMTGRLYVLTAVNSVISARLLYVFTNFDRFDSPLQIFAVWQGGLVAYGGFLGGFLTGVVASYLRSFNYRLLTWADCVVPSLGTGLLFTRIGCLMFGCDFGRPVEVGSAAARWALEFPRGSPAFAEQLKHGLIQGDAARSLPVHPTQIYEALIGLALFGITMLVRRFRRFSGETFCVFTMSYGVLRFFVETLRADEQRGEIGPLSTSQFIGVLTAGAAAIFYVYLYLRWRRDPAAARYWEQRPAGAAPGNEPAGAKREPVAESPRGRRRRRK